MNDVRIVYTDVANVTANNHGIVINFLQGLGGNNAPMAIARVGMSVDHASNLVKALDRTVNKVLKDRQPANNKTQTKAKHTDSSSKADNK